MAEAVRGEKNSWQTGAINGAPHAIEMCGSRTGHSVRTVAFCKDAETAAVLVEALAMLMAMHDLNPNNTAKIKTLLQRAGLVE